MFKIPEMRVSDYTCLLCGSKLGLAMTTIKVGDNSGSCPMCNEPYIINITDDEMSMFLEIEKKHGAGH